MAKVREYAQGGHQMWEFYCPGCGHNHHYTTKNLGMGHPIWVFNGDVESPTFTPSLLNKWGRDADPEWKEPEGAQPSHKWSGTCHLYVTNGQIRYLTDCTHHLAGQVVDMKDM